MSRDQYADVGRATRAAIRAATTSELTATELRVFLAVLDRLSTFSKLSDRTSTRQLASIVYYGTENNDEVQGWQRRHVSRALARLSELGVIEYEPGAGRSARPIIRLPERVPVETRSGVERDPTDAPSNPDPDAKGDQDHSRKVTEIARKGDRDRGHSEKLTEESSEQRIERVLDHVVATATATTDVRDPVAFRRSVIAKIDRARLDRIVRSHPSAPVEMLAAAAVGEQTPYLRFYLVAS